MWIDHHCHLPESDAAASLLDEARAAGVDIVVNVGTTVEGSRRAIELAAQEHGRATEVWATAGVHPHDAAGGLGGLDALTARPEVVAIGECGLDYHYLHSPVDDQRRVFAAQIALAHQHDLPLVVHSREAWPDTFDILGAEGVPERTVLHCFTGGPTEARRCLDLGAVLSFSGIVSFPSATELHEAAALCPGDRFLVETDSPYLAPVPHRGRPNRPALVAAVGAALAAIRGESVDAVAEQASATTRRIYRFDAAR